MARQWERGLGPELTTSGMGEGPCIGHSLWKQRKPKLVQEATRAGRLGGVLSALADEQRIETSKTSRRQPEQCKGQETTTQAGNR